MSLIAIAGLALKARSAASFIGRHWEVFAIAGCAIVFFGAFYAFAQGRERAVWKPQVEQLKQEKAKLIADHKAVSEQALADKQATETAAANAAEKRKVEDAKRTQELDAAVGAAVARVRRHERGRIRSCPQAEAPAAQSGDHAESGTYISERDGEFLIRFAGRCNAVVNQLTTCQAEAIGTYSLCSDGQR